ncbi:MAG: universal stress protein [Bacteroidetes bacterium]|nr:universal stress protein [Bacteroidota bacterium]
MKNIIVPTDFSDCSLNALVAASFIARKTGATIHLTHIYERPVYGFVDLFYDNVAEEKILEQIDRKILQLMKTEYLRGIKLKKLLLTDIELEDLTRDKRVRNADLSVMGSHGVSGIKELMVGSNTEKIVRFSDIPVLVIKEKPDHFEMKAMVFASTFDSDSSESFTRIYRLARVYNPLIHLLKVNTRNHFERTPVSINAMENFAKEFSLRNYSVNTWNDTSIEDGILNFANHTGADVISIETRGLTGLSHLVLGSITENLVNHINRPVLSIKFVKVSAGSSKRKNEPDIQLPF